MSSSADAVARETAWLQTSSGDSLPFLPASAGGPWDVIAAYTQGAQTRTQATAIYVTRGRAQQYRVANQRIRPRYPMRLELRWPVRVISPGSSSISAVEQQAFDDAIELLRQRVTGPLGDKTHGGRFLSAAEVKGAPGIDVQYENAAQTIRDAKEVRAVMMYSVDDFEINA
jgi:hypothetical protein